MPPILSSHHFRAMNCQMSAHVYSVNSRAEAALKDVERWMHEVEVALSRFRPDSDLSRLNAQSGQWYPAGDILWDVTQRAMQAAASSNGRFDPAIGTALIAAGYDRSFEQLEARSQSSLTAYGAPPTAHGAWPRAHGTWRDIRFDESTHTILLPFGCQLDLGGIAKGWAADQALAMLSPFGPALVDAGGDLAVGDSPPDSTGWRIGVADPLVPHQDLALINVAHAGVATSGSDYRRWQHHGRVQHHLIDPASGQPVETNILSATVIAATACAADLLALEAIVGGSDFISAYLRSQPDLPLLLIYTDGRTDQTPAFANFVQAYNPIYAR